MTVSLLGWKTENLLGPPQIKITPGLHLAFFFLSLLGDLLKSN
jgi:hypothetical protein